MKASLLCWKAGSKTELASMVGAARAGRDFQPTSSAGTVRLSFAYSGTADLKAKLERADAMLASGSDTDESGGIYCRTVDRSPSIAFLYPGQGSQRVNMLRGLRPVLPEFENHLQRLETLYGMISDESLLDLIYTTPSRETEERLRDTQIAQPALGVVETALRFSLEALGVHAQFHAGHSYGELPALCGAGLLDDRLLMKLSLKRGKLLAEAGQKAPGAMIALAAPVDDVKALCDEVDDSLEIVNINSPKQLVVAGPIESINRLEQTAGRHGMPASRLNTSCAFHSSLMAPVAPEWRQFLARTLANGSPKPTAQVFSNVTTRLYSSPAEMSDLLGNQITSPVRWADVCTNLKYAGANIFIEVGPGRVLSDLMSRNSASRPGLVLPVDPLESDGDQHITNLLAQLAAAGVELPSQRLANDSIFAVGDTAANSKRNFFEASRSIVERYFAQQTTLVELALRNATASDQKTLTQSAIAANQKIVSEFLTASESVARCITGEEVAITQIAQPQVQERVADVAKASPRTIPALQSPANGCGGLAGRVEAELRSAISEATGFPPESIDRNNSFNNLGIDSLSMAEIWSDVANKIPDVAGFADKLFEIRSLADVAALSEKMPVSPATVPGNGRGTNRPADPQPSTDDRAPFSAQSWSSVRSRLVESISAATGFPATGIGASSDFERDLNLNVFKREEIFRKHLFDHPRFGQAGRALLDARSLSDLDALLERFDTSDVHRASTSGIVERFVLREEPLDHDANEIAFPSAVLLAAGAPSPEFDCVSDMLTRRGISVSPIYLQSDLRIDAHMMQSEQIVFLAQTEKDSTSLFVLAKSLWGDDIQQQIMTRIAILGSEAYGPGARGSVGVARSLRRELPQIAVRNVWLDSLVRDANEQSLVGALFSPRIEGDVRVSRNGVTRETLEHTRKPSESLRPSTLGRDSRILVLGGGDGISAEIAIGLARSYGCEIIAMGRTPWPESLPYPQIDPGPETDRALKRAILEDLSADASLNAEALQQQWKRVSRQRALWSTKMRIENAGGRFSYCAVDVTDAEAFSNSIRSIQSAGPIHGLIHGAGIVRDNLLSRKSVDEFSCVVATKAVPAHIVRDLLQDEPLEFVFFLSSMTSYTGTAGQTDYAAANEILNSVAREWNVRASYPVKSLLWSVWTETGLASTVLKRQMAKMKLDGIPTDEGVSLLIHELTHSNKADDWVLLAPFSTLHYSMQPSEKSGTPSKGRGERLDARRATSAIHIKPAPNNNNATRGYLAAV
jgi:malonyl CoA-acyl carrier protein transacylase/NAD(P)-dependent dehydrogenase (short-subunit alcohol dehydrogenase family)